MPLGNYGVFSSRNFEHAFFSEMDKELPSKINAAAQLMSLELNTTISVEVQSSAKYLKLIANFAMRSPISAARFLFLSLENLSQDRKVIAKLSLHLLFKPAKLVR